MPHMKYHRLDGHANFRTILLQGTSRFRRQPIRSQIATIFMLSMMVFFVWSKALIRVNDQSDNNSPMINAIPQKIWQIYFNNTGIEGYAPLLRSWIMRNQDYAYTLVSSDGADTFVRKHYSGRPEILEPYLDLRVPILRTDLLRYMLLESEGGVYSDLDTEARKSIEDWVPETWKSHVRAIIGIEYDQLDQEPYIGMTERLQFCQWTIAAARGHPIMRRVVQDVVEALRTTAEFHQTSIGELDPTDHEVVEVSGPVIWTRAVLGSLSEITTSTVDYRNFTGIQTPHLIGDVLVLPIDGFGTGQPHSNARTDESGDVYVRHMWKGSWKHNWGS